MLPMPSRENNKRDEFSAATIRKLHENAGGRCSSPTCRKFTFGPAGDPKRRTNIGVAAHIVAAAGKGPRADPSLTPEQRKSIENGIWLCQNCGKAVDSDVSRYTIEQLTQWKHEAEDMAAAEIVSSGPSRRREESLEIRVHSSELRMWRQQGQDPYDMVVVISLWAPGELRYSCRLSLRNDSSREELLQDARIEFRADGQVLYSDTEWANGDDIRLPAGQWVTFPIDSGARKPVDVTAIDKVVLRAYVLGTGVEVQHGIALPPPANPC